MCGEKTFLEPTRHLGLGSPPRVRGKVLRTLRHRNSVGITPACAGKSRYRSLCVAVCRDHPRVCGEKVLSNLAKAVAAGSPPRVRGKGARICQNLERVGITPACAGKSWWISSRRPDRRDHPRVCGEKPLLRALKNTALGSPPRVRGKGCTAHALLEVAGITPACAGKRCVFYLS